MILHGGNTRLGICGKVNVNIFQSYAVNRALRQAVNIAGSHLSTCTAQIAESEFSQTRCPLVHRQSLPGPDVFTETVRIAAVIPHVDNHRSQHTVHFDIIKDHTVNDAVFAAASACLDTQASVCAPKAALADTEIAHSGADFTSQCYGSVTVFHKTVAYGMVVRRLPKGPAQFDSARFYGNTVISNAETASDDVHPVTGLGIKGIRVRAVFRGADRQSIKSHILGIIGMQLPGSGIAGMQAVHCNIPAAVEEKQPRPGNRILPKAAPPTAVLSVTVHCSGPYDNDILRILGSNQCLIHGHCFTLKSAEMDILSVFQILEFSGNHGITGPVSMPEQNSSFLKLQCDVAFKSKRCCQIPAGRKHQPSSFREEMNGSLDSRAVVVHPVAHSSEAVYIQCAGFIRRAEKHGFSWCSIPLICQCQFIFRFRFKVEDREHIGIAPACFFPVQEKAIISRSIIRPVIDQFQASGA